jgi:hypothetical protein
MDQEEILQELGKLIKWVGPAGEQIFDLALAYERIEFFNKFRILLNQKDLANDHTAVDVLNWAYQALADQ